MTSSNETFPRSRAFTYFAGVLALLGFAGIGLLFVLVNNLDTAYGSIQRDIDRYTLAQGEERIRLDALIGQKKAEQAQLDGLRNKNDEEEGRKTKLASDLADIQDKLAEKNREFNAAEKTIAEADKIGQQIDELTKKRDGLLEETKDLERKQSERANLVEEIAKQNANLGRLQENVDGLKRDKADLDELSSKAKDLEDRATAASANLQESEEKRANLDKELELGKAQRDSLKNDNDREVARLASLKQQNNDLAEKNAQIDSDNRSLEAEKDKLEPKVKEARALSLAVTALEKETEDRRATLQQLGDDLAKAEAEREDALNATEKAKGELEDLKADIDKRRPVIADIEIRERRLIAVKAELQTEEQELASKQNMLEGLQAEIAGKNDELQKVKEELARLNGRLGALQARYDAELAKSQALPPAEIPVGNVQPAVKTDAPAN